jgi:hypothetical protein
LKGYDGVVNPADRATLLPELKILGRRRSYGLGNFDG